MFQGSEELLESYVDAIEINDAKDFINFSKLEYQSITLDAMPQATQRLLLTENAKLLKAIAGNGADEITKTTFEQIGRVVTKHKDDYGKLVKELKSKFGEMRKGRSSTIARTELGRISSVGRLKGAVSGGATHKEWVWSGIERSFHQWIESQPPIRIDQDFISELGNPAPAPRMFGVAMEDINCECSIVYLTLEE